MYLLRRARVWMQCLLAGDVWRSKLWLVDLAGSERVGKTEAQLSIATDHSLTAGTDLQGVFGCPSCS